jgi:dihydropteroate synthase
VLILGILNVTPDSFSDGGRFLDPARAVAHGLALIAEGADALDVGGESTRPGAQGVDGQEELRRVLPVIEGLRAGTDLPLSIDTRKPGVARAALAAGASVVNDIGALRDPAMRAAVRDAGAEAILMHMQGNPGTMQGDPRYGDVVKEVGEFLLARASGAEADGIPRDRLILDPGIGFGKRLEHNLAILKRLPELVALGYPVLVGPSRKSFLGEILGLPVEERLEGTAAAVACAVMGGAAMVRVHDVKEMLRVVRVAEALWRRTRP